MPTITNERLAEEKSRLVLINLSGLSMRLMENWRHGTADILGRMPDYETIMIIGAVIGIGGEKLVRTEVEEDLQNLASQFPEDRLTKCNISSIAAATGLGRETVRRKLNELLRDGLMVKGRRWGVRVAPGVLQRPQMQETLRAQLEAVGRAVNHLARLDVLQQKPR